MTEQGLAEVRLRLIPYNAHLVDARKAKGWTQMHLSLLTGINVCRIGMIETLKAIPSDDFKNEIADALEKPVEYLFPPDLMDSVKEGIFGKRVVELSDHRILKQSPEVIRGLLPAHTSSDPFREANIYYLRKQIEEILDTLPPRMKKVLILRFGLDGKGSRTCEEVGEEFKVTRVRIQQIEHVALKMMRHPSRSRKLKDYVFDEE